MRRMGFCLLILGIVLFCACTLQEDPGPSMQWPGEESSALHWEEGADFGMEEPVFVTSFGQSADLLMLTAILDRLDIACTVDALAAPEDFGEAPSVILVVGASSKGLAASEIALQDEQARAEEWAAALEDSACQVMVAHLGGSARRDDSTMSLAQRVLPAADVLLIVSEGDNDEYFKAFAADHHIPYLSAPTVAEAKAPLSSLFATEPSPSSSHS